MPQGEDKVAAVRADVRRDRTALRPGQPDHDVPPRRALAAQGGRAAGPGRRAAPCSTSPAARATCASISAAPAIARCRSTSASACSPPIAAARRGCRPTSCGCRCPTARSTARRAGSRCATSSSCRAFFDELGRVVRPGGRIALLDVGIPRNRLIRWGNGIYFGKVVPEDRRAAERRRRLPLPAEERRLPALARARWSPSCTPPGSPTPSITSCRAASPSCCSAHGRCTHARRQSTARVATSTSTTSRAATATCSCATASGSPGVASRHGCRSTRSSSCSPRSSTTTSRRSAADGTRRGAVQARRAVRAGRPRDGRRQGTPTVAAWVTTDRRRRDADLDTPRRRPSPRRAELHDRAAARRRSTTSPPSTAARDAVRDGRHDKAVIAREICGQQRRADRHPRRAACGCG